MPNDDDLYPWRVGPGDLFRSIYQCADKADAERLCADCNAVGGQSYRVMHVAEIRRLMDEAAAKSAVAK